jgi:hypothetical protein
MPGQLPQVFSFPLRRLTVVYSTLCSIDADASRPVGIAFDNHGRMFISSDASGEVYVVVKDQATTAPSSTSTGSVPSSTPSGSAPASTVSASAAERSTLSYLNIVVTINALLLASYIF